MAWTPVLEPCPQDSHPHVSGGGAEPLKAPLHPLSPCGLGAVMAEAMSLRRAVPEAWEGHFRCAQKWP